MTSSETLKDFEQLVFRLERNHKCVLRLSKSLDSYKYEPKNYDCFIKLRELKNSFSDLAKQQMTLFDAIQHQTIKFKIAVERVDHSIERFQQLEKGMAEYLLTL